MVAKDPDLKILTRLFSLEGKRVSPKNARLFLAVKFPAKDRAKIKELGEKSNEGKLTTNERHRCSTYARSRSRGDLYGRS